MMKKYLYYLFPMHITIHCSLYPLSASTLFERLPHSTFDMKEDVEGNIEVNVV